MVLRRRYNKLIGTLADTIDDTDTTITFTAPLADMAGNAASVESPDIIVMVIDNEIVYITDYEEDALTATISRGEEDTVAATHLSGAKAVNALTEFDAIYWVTSEDVSNIVTITQAAYDLLSPPDQFTLYVIIEE